LRAAQNVNFFLLKDYQKKIFKNKSRFSPTDSYIVSESGISRGKNLIGQGKARDMKNIILVTVMERHFS